MWTEFLKGAVVSWAILIGTAISNAAPLHIVVDPGHGGSDDGATRPQLKEAHLVLDISRRLERLLSKDPRFRVTLTRSSDQSLSLSARKQITIDTGADLFLSIHANASQDPRAKGVEFYFQHPITQEEAVLYLASQENHEHQHAVSEARDAETAQSDLSAILSDLERQALIRKSRLLSISLLENWDLPNRSRRARAIRQAPFYLVSDMPVPSVLVEVGFISNPGESKILKTPRHQEQIAMSIYNGLVQFKEKVDKQRPVPLK